MTCLLCYSQIHTISRVEGSVSCLQNLLYLRFLVEHIRHQQANAVIRTTVSKNQHIANSFKPVNAAYQTQDCASTLSLTDCVVSTDHNYLPSSLQPPLMTYQKNNAGILFPESPHKGTQFYPGKQTSSPHRVLKMWVLVAYHHRELLTHAVLLSACLQFLAGFISVKTMPEWTCVDQAKFCFQDGRHGGAVRSWTAWF